MSSGKSSNKTYTTTNTRNAPNTIGERGTILNLTDNAIDGSTIHFETADAELARNAIMAVKEVADGVKTTTTQLAAGANKIASEVAASQSKFLATQTGQGTTKLIVLTTALGLGAMLVGQKVFQK